MPATTTGGIPYVLPADHPLEFPAHSQQLALAIDAGKVSTWTVYTGWADVGGLLGGLYVTRMGPLVVVEGIVKRTSSLTVAANNSYQIGTIPVGFRPAHQVLASTVHKTAAATFGTLGKLWVLGTGDLHLVTLAAGTLNTDHDVTVNITYRGA